MTARLHDVRDQLRAATDGPCKRRISPDCRVFSAELLDYPVTLRTVLLRYATGIGCGAVMLARRSRAGI